MKKKIKRKSLKKINKYLKRENKRLEGEKEKTLYELANLDDLSEEKVVENFNKHYGFIKKLVG